MVNIKGLPSRAIPVAQTPFAGYWADNPEASWLNEQSMSKYGGNTFTPEKMEQMGMHYLGRPILTDADFQEAHAIMKATLEGQPGGTKDALGMWEVPNDKTLLDKYGATVIGGLALAGTVAGAAGLFGTEAGAVGGTLGATEGTAALTGAGLEAPVGQALSATGAGMETVTETAINNLMAGGMSQEAAAAAVASGGASMGGGSSVWDVIFGKGAGVARTTASGGLMNALSQFYAANQYKKAGEQAAQMSDPFGSQRPAYQDMLMQSYTDPNFFANNPIFQGLQQNAADQTNARMAAMGYNMSGNQIGELGKVATQTGFNYALPFQAQLAQNAGAGISPGYAGFLQQQGANQATQSQMRGFGNLGAAGSAIYDIFKGGGFV